jgi:thioredoxin
MIKRVIIYTIFAATAALVSCGGTTNQSKPADQKKDQPKCINITKADFIKKVFNYEAKEAEWNYLGDKPAIVDFWAEWCAPCKMLSPILEELATEYEGLIYIYKVNTDKEKELAKAFGIKAIPSLLFIPVKDEPQMAQGALPKDALKELIDKFLLNKE